MKIATATESTKRWRACSRMHDQNRSCRLERRANTSECGSTTGRVRTHASGPDRQYPDRKGPHLVVYRWSCSRTTGPGR
ncbi:Uncharacterized protein PBTT_01161 [Plasmodiophora brassicae]